MSVARAEARATGNEAVGDGRKAAVGLVMGRIVVKAEISSELNRTRTRAQRKIDLLVDTGASHLVLSERVIKGLGKTVTLRREPVELANGLRKMARVIAPIRLVVNGFAPIVCEAVVLPGEFESLLGYIPLETLNVVLDMRGRLVKKAAVDLKKGLF